MTETIVKYMRLNRITLRALGVWPENLLSSKLYWYYGVFASVVFIGWFNFTQFMNFFYIYHDLQLTATTAYTFFMSLITNTKAYVMIGKAPLVKKLYLQLQTKEFQPKNKEQEKIADSFAFIFHSFYYIFYYTCVALVCLWNSAPIIDGKWGETMPFFTWHPYDYQKRGFYEVTFVYQCISLVFVVMTNINVDAFSCVLMFYVGVQCDIISNTLENIFEFTRQRLVTEERVNATEEEILNEMNHTLLECYEHHKTVLKFAEDVKNILDIPAFLHLTAASISMCLALFQLSVLDPTSGEFFSVLCYQAAISVQLFLYCWSGNEVMERSVQIATGLYKCDWLNTSMEFKRNLLFFMLRVQKPIQIFALNFFILSLDMFKWVLKTSWSVFTVLRRVEDNDI